MMKKFWKKSAAVFLAAVLLLMPALAQASALTPAEAAHLRFGADGKFTILQFADIQDGPGLLPPTAKFLKAALEEAQPDLVVLTGDNIMGSNSKTYDQTKKAISKFMDIFQEAGVPVAAVFGNHDDEGGITKEQQMAIYMTYDCFIGYDEGPDIYGVGNYNVLIYSSTDAGKVAYNLWMIDSGTYDAESGGYDYVRPSQIAWYQAKSDELKAANGGVPVDSMMFQHIVIPEVYECFNEVAFGTPGAVAINGKFYVLNPDLTHAGVLGEGAYSAHVNGGLFDAVLAQGDVRAMIFGHDHANTYEVDCRGVDLICSPTAGMASYGTPQRGARVIEIDENNTAVYQTRLVKYSGYFTFGSLLNPVYNVMYGFWQIAFPVMKVFYLIDSVTGLSVF